MNDKMLLALVLYSSLLAVAQGFGVDFQVSSVETCQEYYQLKQDVETELMNAMPGEYNSYLDNLFNPNMDTCSNHLQVRLPVYLCGGLFKKWDEIMQREECLPFNVTMDPYFLKSIASQARDPHVSVEEMNINGEDYDEYLELFRFRTQIPIDDAVNFFETNFEEYSAPVIEYRVFKYRPDFQFDPTQDCTFDCTCGERYILEQWDKKYGFPDPKERRFRALADKYMSSFNPQRQLEHVHARRLEEGGSSHPETIELNQTHTCKFELDSCLLNTACAGDYFAVFERPEGTPLPNLVWGQQLQDVMKCYVDKVAYSFEGASELPCMQQDAECRRSFDPTTGQSCAYHMERLGLFGEPVPTEMAYFPSLTSVAECHLANVAELIWPAGDECRAHVLNCVNDVDIDCAIMLLRTVAREGPHDMSLSMEPVYQDAAMCMESVNWGQNGGSGSGSGSGSGGAGSEKGDPQAGYLRIPLHEIPCGCSHFPEEGMRMVESTWRVQTGGETYGQLKPRFTTSINHCKIQQGFGHYSVWAEFPGYEQDAHRHYSKVADHYASPLIDHALVGHLQDLVQVKDDPVYTESERMQYQADFDMKSDWVLNTNFYTKIEPTMCGDVARWSNYEHSYVHPGTACKPIVVGAESKNVLAMMLDYGRSLSTHMSFYEVHEANPWFSVDTFYDFTFDNGGFPKSHMGDLTVHLNDMKQPIISHRIDEYRPSQTFDMNVPCEEDCSCDVRYIQQEWDREYGIRRRMIDDKRRLAGNRKLTEAENRLLQSMVLKTPDSQIPCACDGKRKTLVHSVAHNNQDIYTHYDVTVQYCTSSGRHVLDQGIGYHPYTADEGTRPFSWTCDCNLNGGDTYQQCIDRCRMNRGREWDWTCTHEGLHSYESLLESELMAMEEQCAAGVLYLQGPFR